MTELLDYWQAICMLVAVACIPVFLGILRRPESWSDRVSRERGWPTGTRTMAAEPTAGAAFVDTTGSAGGDCGGSAGSGGCD